MPLRSFQYVVSGTVQGVGFRWFLKRRAESYGVVGWTQNSSTGDVIGIAEGQVEAMQYFEKDLHMGPSHATVTGVQLTEDNNVPHLSFNKFEIRR